MPRGFGRLPFLARRGTAADRAAFDVPPGDQAGIDVDDAPVGPPVLLPAMIHRMILVDTTELTPVWARPRPPQPEATGPAAAASPREPEPAVASVEPAAPKPTRKRKAGDGSGPPKAAAAPRGPRKAAGNRRRTS